MGTDKPNFAIPLPTTTALHTPSLGAMAEEELIPQDSITTLDNTDSIDGEITTSTRIKNTLIGAAAGLAIGGAVVSVGGVFTGLAGGATTLYLGVQAKQGFAIGAIVYNIAGSVILPLFGVEMEPIEYEPLSIPTP